MIGDTSGARPTAGLLSFGDALLLLLLAVAAVRALSFPAYSQDTWYFMKSGEAMLEARGFPAHELYGQGMENQRWTRSAWAFSVGLGLVVKAWGLDGLLLFRIAWCVASLLGLTWLWRRRGLDGPGAVLLSLAVLWGTQWWWTERPQTLTFVLLPLIYAFYDSRRRWLGRLGLAACGAIWANCHDSVALLLLPWGVAGLMGLARRQRFVDVLADGAALLGGMLCNPDLAGPLTRTLTFLRKETSLTAALQEWRPANWAENGNTLAVLAGFGALALFQLTRWPKSLLSPAGICALVMSLLSFSSRRFLPYAVLSAAYWAAGAGIQIRWRPWAWAALGLASLAWARDPELGQIRFLLEKYPVGAAEFLAQDPPAGRLAHSRIDGDYLLWRLGPGQKVFVDSRQAHIYPLTRLAHEIRIIGADPQWRDSVKGYGITAILASKRPREVPIIAVLRQEPGWRPVYEDATSVLFARPAEKGQKGTWPKTALKARP